MANPTVVVGHINDEEIKKSIDSLVTHVNEGVSKMVQSFDGGIARIKKELESLGKFKIDMPDMGGSTTSGRSSGRASRQKEETQAVKETTAAYDEMARAMQMATRSAFVNITSDSQKLLNEIRSIQFEIKALEKLMPTMTGRTSFGGLNISDARQYDELINRVIRRIQEMNGQVVRFQKSGNMAAAEGLQKTVNAWSQQLQYIQQQREVWEKQQVEVGRLTSKIDALKAQIEKLREQYNAMGRAMEGSIAPATKAIVESAEEIERRNKEVAESQERIRQKVIQTGYAAQEQAKQIVQSMHTQATNIDSTEAIKGLSQLYDKWREMQRAFSSMNQGEKDSALGKALKEDIDRLQKIMPLINEYNRRLMFGGQQNNQNEMMGRSYKDLQEKIKELISTYQQLDEEERNSARGRGVINKLQQAQREVQEINKQMARPTSLKNALSLEERSLDQITYKINQLRAYMNGLDSTNAKSANEIKQVTNELNRLKEKQREILGENKALIDSNTALGRSWNYMKNRLAFYFTIGASTQFVRQLIDIRGQYEMTEKALGILVDSAERGTQIFNELSQMALVSPYTLIELSNAARQLTAYDVAAKDVVDTTRRLADMAAAVGIPIDRLTYALGQIKAYGYLNARDARMFANAGIPIIQQLSDYYTQLEGKLVSTSDIYDRIKKKAIGYRDVMTVIYNMTDEGGKFFDFQAKMADTLRVQLANLTLAWNNFLNDLGASEQSLISMPIKMLKDLFLMWKDINHVLNNILIIFGTFKAIQFLSAISFGKVTREALKNASALQDATAADYQNAFANTTLTKTQAKLIIATNRENVELRQAIVNMRILTTEEAKSAAMMSRWRMGWLTITHSLKGVVMGIKSVALSMAELLIGPQTIIFALVDLFTHMQEVSEFNKEFNKGIAEGAAEAAKSIDEFLKLDANIQALAAATNGKLNETEAQKTWGIIREELEKSAISASVLVANLNDIQNVNERIVKGFEYAKKIKEVEEQLSGLYDELKIDQDSFMWGSFGEGLSEDLEDYNNFLKTVEKNTEFSAKKQRGFWESIGLGVSTLGTMTSELMGNSLDEAKEEIEEFANDAAKVIKEKLGEEGVKDSVKVTEAIARIIKQVEEQNPKIQGKAKTYFETYLDELFSQQFGENVYSKATNVWKLVLNQIKKDSSSTFATLTNDILDENAKWSKGQEEAINKAIDKVRQDLPSEFASILDEMQKDLNSRSWKINITTTFDTQALTAYMKEQRDKYLGEDFNSPVISNEERKRREERWITLLRKEGEDRVEYEKRLQDERKKAKEAVASYTNGLKAANKEAREEAKVGKESAEQRLKDIETIQKAENLREEKETKKNKRGGKQDPFGDALAKELQLIQDIQKLYKEYQKAGVDAQTAVTLAAKEYGKSLSINNARLAKFGINGLSGEELANMDLRSLREFYESILPKASSSAKGVEALEKAIRNLNAEITKTDYKKITDGLNNELSKISDEYELGVQIQASPELGDIFTDMFNLNLDNLPMSIEDVVQRYQDAVDKAIAGALYGGADLDIDDMLDSFNLLTDDLKEWANTTGVEVSSELYKNLEKGQKNLRKLVEKNKIDIIKQTTDLRYKLTDNAGKIAIAEGELARLQMRLYRETNEERRELLRLQIQDQENTIQKLKEEALQLLPFYANLFNGIADRSRARMRELINNAKEVTKNAKEGYNEKGEKVYTLTDLNGEQTTISAKKYQELLRRINKEEEKLETPWDKIRKKLDATNKDAFDLFGAIELIGSEAQKLGQIVGEIGNIAQELGADEATVEVINDVATSIEGVGTAAQGVAQIQAGDYLGGALNVIKGVWGTISSWFDNKNKKIDRQVKESERQVKRLELAYKDLEEAMNKAYGTATVGAKKAAIANKELQLVELRRQLALEKSRDSKKRDEDKIIDIQKQIKDLQYEINNSTMEIVNDLLGIGSAGDFAEDLVSSMIESFKKGEDYMAVFEGKFEDMVDNMIMKMIVSKVVSQYIDGLFENLDQRIGHRADKEAKAYAEAQAEYDRRMNTSYTDYKLHESGWNFLDWESRKPVYGDYLAWQEAAKKNADAAKKQLDAVSQITDSDLDYVLGQLGEIMPELGEKLKDILGKYYKFGQDSDSTLSALQQGIQGITEDTAGALEAYMNSVNQQVYYQSDILTQIRDEIVLLDGDAQLATNAQILLQLQQSYQIQLSIRNTLNDWSNASGRAVKVELIN